MSSHYDAKLYAGLEHCPIRAEEMAYQHDHERVKAIFAASRQYLGLLSASERLAKEVKDKSDRLKRIGLEIVLTGFLLFEGCTQVPPRKAEPEQKHNTTEQGEYHPPTVPSRCR